MHAVAGEKVGSLTIVFKDIILRDFVEEDIEKRVHWEKEETEWQQWDAPWEYEGLTKRQKEEELQGYIDTMRRWVKYYQSIGEDEKRDMFQIVSNGDQQTYIGWVSAYCIDDNWDFTNKKGRCTVGIDIPDMSARGKGYSYQALCAFIDYLFAHEEEEIYTQTWSGNGRMIHIAAKMGFEECHRKAGLRTLQGKAYDGLTFKLNKEKYNSFRRGLLEKI